MDYKEKYESALGRARIWKDKSGMPKDRQGILDDIFPELKESEDERIRKELIRAFQSLNTIKVWNGIERIDILAWLEKQDNQTIFNTPSRETILAIWELGNDWKELTKGVVSTEHGTQLDYIQKHWSESEHYLREKRKHEPASNEQQGSPIIEIPFGAKDSELQEASYHIPEGFHAEIQGDKVVIKKGEKKSSWSEDDENNLTDTCVAIRKFYHGTNGAQELIDWLKFLKDRVEPQLKQQWSEDDENMFVDLIKYCGTSISYAQAECYKVEWEKRKGWLQSLKQRCTWKPSDEQIRALRWVLNNIPYNTHKEEISGLLEQIKDL